MATRCKVYDKRYNDMPILLVDHTGDVRHGFCLHGSEAEEMTLRPLIRQGQCSLEEG
jgi:hypothetical protein